MVGVSLDRPKENLRGLVRMLNAWNQRRASLSRYRGALHPNNNDNDQHNHNHNDFALVVLRA